MPYNLASLTVNGQVNRWVFSESIHRMAPGCQNTARLEHYRRTYLYQTNTAPEPRLFKSLNFFPGNGCSAATCRYAIFSVGCARSNYSAPPSVAITRFNIFARNPCMPITCCTVPDQIMMFTLRIQKFKQLIRRARSRVGISLRVPEERVFECHIVPLTFSPSRLPRMSSIRFD